MRLSEDFARNRKVFEMLTSTGVSREPDAHTEPEPVFSNTKPVSTPEPAPVESYSLKYGTRAATGMALRFEAPGPMEYPQRKGAAAAPQADPLEPLYRRLEVEARLGSQLLGEEEF